MQILLDRQGLKSRGITFTNAHLIRLENAGKFPRRLRITAGRVAWLQDEIDGWIEAKAAARGVKRSTEAA